MKNLAIVSLSVVRRLLLVTALSAASVQLVSAEDNPANNQVATVQQALKLKHFYYGEVDGNFDDATQGALRRFQFRNGLPGTGEMDDATLQTLNGNAPLAKPAITNVAAQVERTREIAAPVEKDGNSIASPAIAITDQRAKLAPRLNPKELLAVPNAAYTLQVPSWFAEHRANVEPGVEVHRAVLVAPTVMAPAAIGDGEETSPEAVTTVTAHFTGQDGHIYTYYRKIKTRSPEASNSPAPLYGIGETAASFPLRISDRSGARGGNIADR